MGKGTKGARKTADRAEKAANQAANLEALTEPLTAFPADPPRKNLSLLIVASVLFSIWFCYLAWVALKS